MAKYGIVTFWPGTPGDSQQLLLHAVALPAEFDEGLTASRAYLNTAATASTTVTIKKNGTAKATVTFAAGSKLGVFTCAAAWEVQPGDKIEFVAPASADATADGVAITLMGSQLERTNLFAALECNPTTKATLDHIFLFATLECEADIVGAGLNLGNLFPQTILYSEAFISRAILTDQFSFKTFIGTDGCSELNSFLTVVHDGDLFT